MYYALLSCKILHHVFHELIMVPHVSFLVNLVKYFTLFSWVVTFMTCIISCNLVTVFALLFFLELWILWHVQFPGILQYNFHNSLECVVHLMRCTIPCNLVTILASYFLFWVVIIMTCTFPSNLATMFVLFFFSCYSYIIYYSL